MRRIAAGALAGALLVVPLHACAPSADLAQPRDAAPPEPAAPAADPGAPPRRGGPFDDVSVAAREAASTGASVELRKRRTANSRTYINPDGTTTVESTDATGRKSRVTSNTPPSVNRDIAESPATCNEGLGAVATSLTPTLSVSVSDVDHRVQGARSRVHFEVWPAAVVGQVAYAKLDPSGNGAVDPVAVGVSPWVAPGERATWTVPADALAEGEDEEYVWRARADDGDSIGAYPSWTWSLLAVDTSLEPGVGCEPELLLQYVVENASQALYELVEAEPRRYGGWWSSDLGALRLWVRPRAGESDAAAIRAARAAAARAFAEFRDPADETVRLTDEDARAAADVLEIRLAEYSHAQLAAVTADLESRYGTGALWDRVVDLDEDPDRGCVVVGVRDMTEADAERLRAAHRDKVCPEDHTRE